MKFVNKKTALLLVSSSLVLSCMQTGTSNLPVQVNHGTEINNSIYGKVIFNFDFPAKFTSTKKVEGFSIKAVDEGKINRIRLKVQSATTSFIIERNVELVPGGISAVLNLPLDKLYTVTVQGMNDTVDVSGSEIKGYFALVSSIVTPTVEVNQSTTPVAKIIEAVKARLGTEKPAVTATATPSPEVASASPSSNTGLPVATVAPTATPTPTFVAPPFKLADIDIAALEDVVKRARGATHPSLVNITPFVDSIVLNKTVPIEVPLNPLIKPGRIKGKLSGLKFNEVAVITVGDPASKQIIVGTPTQVVSVKDTKVDPDKVAPEINFNIDNVTPGSWEIIAVASGYTGDTKVNTLKITAGTESSSTLKLTSGAWLKSPNTISGNIGTSDQSNTAVDPVNNIHIVWRQDGFDTDTNSGVIFYSRWNGTSWTTQGVNISQYNESNLKGAKDPAVAVGLDRLPHAVWSGKESTGARKIFYNNFNGITWKTPVAVNGSNDGITPSLTVDKTNGFLYVVWEAGGKILMAQYDKTNWSSTIQVGTGIMPKINMGTDGIAHIVWKSPTDQKLLYNSWTIAKGLGTAEVIPLGTHGVDADNSIETCMDRFNRLHLVWRNDFYIQYILRSNVSWSLPEIVNELPTALLTAKSGASISIASTGIVNVAWVSPLQGNKDVIRFRRKLQDGWKQPFTKIFNPTETIPAGTSTNFDTDLHSENIDGYEDIPLSQISSGVQGKPVIVADDLGKIHVIWSNKGVGSNDTDLLHSVKTIAVK